MNKNPFEYVHAANRPARQEKAAYDEFEATELYCPQCGRAVPVRKSLLLILPEGDKYEYRCEYCGSTVGDKIDRNTQFSGILKA